MPGEDGGIDIVVAIILAIAALNADLYYCGACATAGPESEILARWGATIGPNVVPQRAPFTRELLLRAGGTEQSGSFERPWWTNLAV